MPAVFYKGVGVGTHNHANDLRLVGLMPRATGSLNVVAMQQHIAGGTGYSPCISITKSYGVARDYAMNSSLAKPTQATPGHVYEIHIPENTQSPQLIDPVNYISSSNANLLGSQTYHHNGDQNFLGFVAYRQSKGGIHPQALRPPGLSGAGTLPVQLSSELESIVFAIRDAEILVHGNMPASWFVRRYDIF